MAEVQNVGAVDYAQYQPSQYTEETYPENYTTQPEVYDENMAEIQAANKNRMGATLLSGTIAVGIGLLGGYLIGKHGKKDLDGVKKELDELKNSEAMKNYEKLKEAAEKVQKEIEEHNGFSWWGIKDKVKAIFAEFNNSVKKVGDEVKDEAKDATKKAAEETEKKTEEAAKKAD